MSLRVSVTVISSLSGRTIPVVGVEYEDALGRRLKVTEVVEGDRLGREVRGVLIVPGEVVEYDDGPVEVVEGRFFSTTVEGWRHSFHERRPPADPRTMKVGG